MNGDFAAIEHLAPSAAETVLIDATDPTDIELGRGAEPDPLVGQEAGIGQGRRGDVEIDLTRLGRQAAVQQNAAIRADGELAPDVGGQFRALADADGRAFAAEPDLLGQLQGQVAGRLDQVRQGFNSAEQAQILARFPAHGAGIHDTILDADLDLGVVGHRHA